MRRIAILGSGNGSNFEAIVKYFEEKEITFTCISDKEDAYILKRADKMGIEALYIPFDETEEFLSENSFDLIVLAGYMRILPPKVIMLGTFLNIHPSLLPKYPGKDAIKQAFKNKDKLTGITIHIATDKVDEGPIIAQHALSIPENITFEELTEKIHKLEHYVYPKVIEDILFNTKENCGSSCGSNSGCGCSSKGCSSGNCGGCS